MIASLRYLDRFVKTDGAWLFSERLLYVDWVRRARAVMTVIENQTRLVGTPGRKLKVILEYIEESLAQSIALRQLAELAGIRARYLERAFRQAIDFPLYADVLERRIATARELVTSRPRLTVNQIAARTGFRSSSHLALAFRRRTGYLPSRFRALHRH